MERILVVNDESDLLEICQLVLETAGYTVMTACGAAAGMEAALRGKPDLVVIDWVMPEGNGDQLVRSLRADPTTSKVRILMMSALPEVEVEAHILGADGFLAKPFDVAHLVAKVETVLGSARKRHAA